ncbi:hypothetical protein GUJ93_ZPchr0010g9227 [Zizania palustris]|uniref:Uncharacterized protein n=1 Tax=Zizania palustris TaxID=103762 RepID=A0A8J5WEZ9_ZIZPA|nr:hypothetical protein GUJ93_ZPchr0010g9227 [Zizania palustris]
MARRCFDCYSPCATSRAVTVVGPARGRVALPWRSATEKAKLRHVLPAPKATAEGIARACDDDDAPKNEVPAAAATEKIAD